MATQVASVATPPNHISHLPFLGVGLGHREEFHDALMAHKKDVDFLELVVEHFIEMPEDRVRRAEKLAEDFDIIVHGLELSIGTIEPLRSDYVEKIQQLVDRTGAHLVSDHLCLTSVTGRAIGNLSPLPLLSDLANFIVNKCRQAQQMLSVPFLLENISILFRPGPSDMTEPDFISRILRESDTYLLLDLTNAFNNAENERFDVYHYLDQMPLDRVLQIHLAGGMMCENVLLDTHNSAIPEEVLHLLSYAAPRMPNLRAVMIERDQDFPPFDELLQELHKVRGILQRDWAPHFSAGLVASPNWLGGS